MLETLRLDGRVAVVTGASRGPGRAMALALAEAGADLALAGRSRPDLQRTAADAAKRGGRALAVNLRGPALCARAVARTMVLRRQGRIVNVASIGATVPLSRLAPYCASKAGLVPPTPGVGLGVA